MLGLKRGTVELSEYTSAWAGLFQSEVRRILKILDAPELVFEHIGSTSIPNMASKPIIDLMIGFKNMKDAELAVPKLISQEYIRRTNGDLKDRIFLVKGLSSCRTHHISLTTLNSEYWNMHLNFRDTLRNNSVVAKRYLELKKSLAHKYPDNRKLYTEGKLPFVNSVLANTHR